MKNYGYCPVCSAYIDFFDAVQVEYHPFTNDVYAGPHGYCFGGFLNQVQGGILTFVPEFMHRRSPSEDLVYVPCDAVRLFNDLFDMCTANGCRLSDHISVGKNWMRRILEDEEAFSVYQMIRSVGSLEALNRMADILDLSRFWLKA